MTIQINIPDEYVAAVKSRLTLVTGRTPTNAEAFAYLKRAFVEFFTSRFPEAIPAAVVTAAQEVEAKKDALDAALTAALNVTSLP